MAVSDTALTIETPFGPATLDVAASAVIVVDMQNDFGSPGGMFALGGIDIAPIQAAVEPTARVLRAARSAGMPIVYLKMAFREDLSDTGGPDAPNWFKVHAPLHVGDTVKTPDGRAGRILIRDTWNTDILDELAAEPHDTIVYKHRFSGFFETELDDVLRAMGVKSLIITGCTTSVCVESTVRDAMFRDYRCLVLEDCTAEPIGLAMPRSNHDATLLLVNIMFGWVARSEDLISALEGGLEP